MTPRELPHVRRSGPHLLAECQEASCNYMEDVAGTTLSDNARQRAKNHARATGHEVRIERLIVTYLNPRPAR